MVQPLHQHHHRRLCVGTSCFTHGSLLLSEHIDDDAILRFDSTVHLNPIAVIGVISPAYCPPSRLTKVLPECLLPYNRVGIVLHSGKAVNGTSTLLWSVFERFFLCPDS